MNLKKYNEYLDEATMVGVDISHWQGRVDFASLKQQGYDFVIIKCGGSDNGRYKDEKFEEYYKGAKDAGLHVGFYYFAGPLFRGKLSGVYDAQHCLEIVKGKQFDMFCAIDIENQKDARANRQAITDAAIGFCDYMEAAGYYVTIYGSDYSTFVDSLDLNRLKAYDKWVAKYSTSKPLYTKPFGCWQFGGSKNYLRWAKVDGVSSAACDQNFAYKDYPTIIKNAHLNGF